MSTRAYLIWVWLSLALALSLQLLQLPPGLGRAWPIWPALAIGAWAYALPRVSLLPLAWLTGLLMDVLFGTVLGQHALALGVSAFLILKLSGILRAIQIWQSALMLVPIWSVYAFLLFWMDGSTRHDTDPLGRWLPVLTTSLLWPLMAWAWLGITRAARGR